MSIASKKILILSGCGWLTVAPAFAQVLTSATAGDRASDGAEIELIDQDQNATASVSSASLLGSTAFSYGSLASGKSGAYASSDANGIAVGQSRLTEQIYLKVQGANKDTITPITFNLNLDGDILDNATSTFYFVYQVSLTYSGMNNGTAFYDTLYSNYQSNREVVDGWSSVSYFGSASSRDITGTIGIVGPSSTISINSNLFLLSAAGATLDFSHTASVGLSVPENVTYTSASGVFLSQAGTVPEPASWAMMIAGFGVVGLVARRSPARAAA